MFASIATPQSPPFTAVTAPLPGKPCFSTLSTVCGAIWGEGELPRRGKRGRPGPSRPTRSGDSPSSPSSVRTGGSFPRWGKHSGRPMAVPTGTFPSWGTGNGAGGPSPSLRDTSPRRGERQAERGWKSLQGEGLRAGGFLCILSVRRRGGGKQGAVFLKSDKRKRGTAAARVFVCAGKRDVCAKLWTKGNRPAMMAPAYLTKNTKRRTQ